MLSAAAKASGEVLPVPMVVGMNVNRRRSATDAVMKISVHESPLTRIFAEIETSVANALKNGVASS